MATKSAATRVAIPARRGRPPKVRTAGSDVADEQSGRSTLFVNSVAKAMRVLTAFDATQRRLTLSQIAATIEMDISSTQRFTYTLTNLGYLRKDEVSKTYELAPRAVDIAYHYLSSSELVYRATPYMHQLSLQTEEATNLTVLDGCDVMIVSRIVSRYVLNPHVIAGARLPAYCTAPGLAMLAHMPEKEVGRILGESTLTKHTPFTIAQVRQIKVRLTQIREQGYAHTAEEYMLGDISTAAAVLTPNGEVLGAINIAVAKPRWSGPADERKFADLVIAAAAAISGRN